jgi:hypothetical protein
VVEPPRWAEPRRRAAVTGHTQDRL